MNIDEQIFIEWRRKIEQIKQNFGRPLENWSKEFISAELTDNSDSE